MAKSQVHTKGRKGRFTMGLGTLKAKQQAAAEKAASFDRPEIKFLKVPQGQKVDVVFLEELEDVADTHCVEEWEVNGPGRGDYRTLLDTTEEEGACFAAELAKIYREQGLNDEGYTAKRKTKVYFNVVKVDEPKEVYVLALGLRTPVVTTLIEHAASPDDEGYGGITGVVYRISKGADQASSLIPERRPQGKVPTDLPEPIAIEHIVRKVALADQPKYLEKIMPPSLVAQQTEAPAAAKEDSKPASDPSEVW
jgi:hypothetical protein